MNPITPALTWSDGPTSRFTIDRGVCAAIVDPSVVHLQRLTRTLATLSQTPTAHVEVLGINAAEHLNEARSVVAYCSLNAGLYEELNVEQYLEFFASLWAKPWSSVSATIEVCSLTTLRLKSIRQLTPPQRAFVHLARSFLSDPGVFVLDGLNESGLSASEPFWQLLGELSACDKTCVVCCSQLCLAAPVACSEVVVFDHGKLLLSGSMIQLRNLVGDDSSVKHHSVEVKTSAAADELECALRGMDVAVSPTPQGVIVAGTVGSDSASFVAEISATLVAARLPFTALLPSSDHLLRQQVREAIGCRDD